MLIFVLITVGKRVDGGGQEQAKEGKQIEGDLDEDSSEGTTSGKCADVGGKEPAKTDTDDDRAVYCSFQKQTSYTFRGYVLLGERDVTKFQGCTRLAV